MTDQTHAPQCQGRVEDPSATWDAIEICQDTMPCPLLPAPGADYCRRCFHLAAAQLAAA